MGFLQSIQTKMYSCLHWCCTRWNSGYWILLEHWLELSCTLWRNYQKYFIAIFRDLYGTVYIFYLVWWEWTDFWVWITCSTTCATTAGGSYLIKILFVKISIRPNFMFTLDYFLHLSAFCLLQQSSSKMKSCKG